MKRSNLSILPLSIIAVLVLVLALSPVQICRDWEYICENTGSRQGYREWILGSKTNWWYDTSPLEENLQIYAPFYVSHRWTSYAGTGKNLLGRSVLLGHGKPGAILHLRHEVLKQWVEENDPETVQQLYNLLVAGNQSEIDAKIRSISEESMK